MSNSVKKLMDYRKKKIGIDVDGSGISLSMNAFWNFLGKLIYTASRGILLIIIAKLGTSVMVGQYALAVAITSPAFLLADLNLRAVFATDTRTRYSFEHYLGLRCITTLLTLIIIIVIAAFFGNRWETAVLIVLIGIGKCFDTTSDILYGLFQKYERMDKLGISMILKGVLSVLCMGTILWLTHSLVYGVAGLAVAWMLVLLLYDFGNARKYINLKTHIDFRVLWKIVRLCLPLGAVFLCISLNSNVLTYFIKGFLGTNSLGYYASILYIATIGDVMVNSLGQTTSPRLAKLYSNGKLKEFAKLMLNSVWIIIGMSIIGLVIAITGGRQILILLYTQSYGAYHNILILIIISAGFGYLSNFLNYITIAVRMFKLQPVLYGSVLIVGIVSNIILIPLEGLKGAAFSAIITSFLLFAGNLSIIIYALMKIRPKATAIE